MARKKKHEEHENHERWLVSYADFITLLFAFFVVMYSISSVNEGKYRVLSDAIVAAFRSSEKSIRPIQVGEPTRAPKSTQMEVQKTPGIVKTPNPPIKLLDQAIENLKSSGKLTKEEKDMLDLINKLGGIDALEKLRGLADLKDMEVLLNKAGVATNPDQQHLISDADIQAIKEGLQNLADLGGVEGLQKLAEIGGLQGLEELAKVGGLEGLEKLIAAARGEGARNIAKIADDIELAMSGLIQRDLITVDRSDQWIEIEINTSILYPSGSAHLQPDAVPVLKELARILRDFPNPMRIEGFTDNLPINTLVYPSNWELSSARASRVVRLFTDEGISPERMAAIGYGEYRPVASNDTAKGRAKNRRVVLVVLANHDVEDMFNNGILKSGHRTGGFLQSSKQSGVKGSTIDQSASGESEIKKSITPEPQQSAPEVIRAPRQSIASPLDIPVKTSDKSIDPKQPSLSGSASLPVTSEARKITDPSVTYIEVTDSEVPPVTEPSTVTLRQPVVFPPRTNSPRAINESVPTLKQPAMSEPVITIPLPVLVPPIKFVPPISESVNGAVTDTKSLRDSHAGMISITSVRSRAVKPDEGTNMAVSSAENSTGGEITQKDTATTDQGDLPASNSKFNTVSIPERANVNANNGVDQNETESRDPVIFPPNPSIPGVMTETISPTPVIAPPLKFLMPISKSVSNLSK